MFVESHLIFWLFYPMQMLVARIAMSRPPIPSQVNARNCYDEVANPLTDLH